MLTHRAESCRSEGLQMTVVTETLIFVFVTKGKIVIAAIEHSRLLKKRATMIPFSALGFAKQ